MLAMCQIFKKIRIALAVSKTLPLEFLPKAASASLALRIRKV